MALVSEIDWLILVCVAAVLLFSRDNGRILRTLGRYYGRLVKLKNEAMSEITASAGLPAAGGPGPVSIRHYLLADAIGGTTPTSSGVPFAVTTPPQVIVHRTIAAYPFADSLGSGTWSVALPPAGLEAPEPR